jgi:hypothetical protein
MIGDKGENRGQVKVHSLSLVCRHYARPIEARLQNNLNQKCEAPFPAVFEHPALMAAAISFHYET